MGFVSLNSREARLLGETPEDRRLALENLLHEHLQHLERESRARSEPLSGYTPETIEAVRHQLATDGAAVSESLRRLLDLRFNQELSLKATGEQIGFSAQTVKKHERKALTALGIKPE